ncbi:MAG: aminotransferase class V-fold PLP-dependent enzyme [Proteobacteria bacterium]|jgi:alanine-glyoxylate transaminase / serine-glyoxylate transaminase / serine-pyruvate transaminase|nr:aminotransferase class V-fold PLP-dependent enzyme [Pseudomonadota bacterium]
MSTSKYQTGRHFLQIPGPSNVPDRVLRAIDQPTIDHRGPVFIEMAERLFDGLAKVFKCSGPVLVYPGSGSGGWEASLVNVLSAGDRVLMFETGHFSNVWKEIAVKLGLDVDYVPGDWRHGVDPGIVEQNLGADTEKKIKAVGVVHNETSTGCTSDISLIRAAMDNADHPALLLVDAISSLGSTDYQHDKWRVDVTIGGSQKGLMLPPGLAFNAVSEKARKASKNAKLARSYWDWEHVIGANKSGSFPYTPATNLLYGLDVALDMLFEEGLENVFTRHARLAETTRRAVDTWGLENQCLDPKEYSDSLTTVLMPEGFNADELRNQILENFDMSLGMGLGQIKGKVFRIGHLGWFNELMLTGTLCGVEMGLELAGVPFNKGGAQAAMDFMVSENKPSKNRVLETKGAVS